MPSAKEYSKPPTTVPKEMEIQKLPKKEFKTTVLKMLRELQENTNEQRNYIRKAIQKHTEMFNKEDRKPKKALKRNFGAKEHNDRT